MLAVWFRRFLKKSDSSRCRSSSQRYEDRKTIRYPVRVHLDGQSIPCHTINLSASGALLNTMLQARIGAVIQIEVSHLPKLVAARVARVGAHSTAIRFQSLGVGGSLVGYISAQSAREASQGSAPPVPGRINAQR